MSFACLFLGAADARALSREKTVREGNRLYEHGDYGSSIKQYQQALAEEPENDIINFNLGTALYKEDDFDKALPSLQKALLSEDESLRQKAHYNLGNTLYRSGIAKEDVMIDKAIESLKSSIDHYDSSLAIDDEDRDALNNREFVRLELKRLEEKKKQQQQQPSQEQQSGGQKQKDNQQSGQSRSSQSSSGEQPQDEQQQTQEQQDHQEGSSEAEEENETQDNGQTQQDEASGQTQAQQKESGSQSAGQNAQAMSAGEITEQEAKMLLDNYQHTEEPQGLLTFGTKASGQKPVPKDW